ncbi:hypothetical protein GCM10027277_22170 [Pseudoduganella ginsengisoli]|uniref:Uncharacterized protein n=1 Tax=Pseudoduganella ginsengisoli TaxID=1462440 RepID=A0A6L6PSP5_9BURK|nr:hypothetical protein [Pseudoduganella ginsengisoli]MTW00530.1 hypothetical protein [Pseudoduganella ginsengisoli]
MPELISSLYQFVVSNALWLSINIAVPVLLPYLMLVLIAIDQATHTSAGTGATTWRTLLRKSVDTGQLFWTAISMLAATAYDAVAAWDKHPALHEEIGWTVGICLVAGFVCTVLVGFSTLRTATSGTTNWYVIGLSIWLTLALCGFYPAVHFSFA